MRSRPLRHRILVALGALGAVLLVAAIGVGLLVGSVSSSFDTGRHTLPSAEAFPAPSGRPQASTGKAAGAINILLLGTDTRGPTPVSLAKIRAQRSDTMLLVHIPADRRRVEVMSIMRDSWVPIPDHGHGKINAALSYGGVPLTVRTVEQLLGVRIDHVAIVSFSGFEGLTDALGGVVVDNAIPFDNLGNHFAEGRTRLTGVAALAYVRARYPFADGDFQRVRNQQAYLKGVLSTVLSSATLLNPMKVGSTVSAIAPYLLVDQGFDATYLRSLAVALPSLRTGDVHFFTAPTSGTGMEGDQSVVYLDDERMRQVAVALRNDTLGQ